MIKVEHIDVQGFEAAVRGMRNPMNSWEKSDSYQLRLTAESEPVLIIGDADLKLMKQLLPSSYNQKRTVMFNYETALTMIRQRSGHKLDEWKEFVRILQEELPYMKELMKP